MDPSQLEQIKQFFVDELMDDSEKKMCVLLQEWERWKKNESTSGLRRSRRHLNRDREARHEKLFNDYFADEPVYPGNVFRRRFRMRKALFLRIVEALANHSEYFQLRVDATGKRGLSPLQKCTAAIRQLAYGVPAN
ncbi:uncharacterized protein LOC120278465 [Dioscorea cayenensis subsp. rotundata]|uniref:Uncharacterized protein LOC120278465 n=1 Tax=Dioscorea cayennensis subsp. rotundata TaxID=55577 RepID=A0AB40CQ51_DIOCR|nr:uncharacterized protein LOC120278465 [Dioscorea cayenensis subsp. rotundata]